MGWPEPARRWKEALGKYRYALLVAAVGVVLLALPSGEGKGPPETGRAETDFDLEAFEEKLEGVLSRIDGAGETRVMLTLDGGSRQVLAQDQDRDGEGGLSSTTVTVGRGSGGQEVVALQTMAPSFRGVLVVCPGGGDAQVRLELIRAVSALTGLGSDSITVCCGNTGN